MIFINNAIVVSDTTNPTMNGVIEENTENRKPATIGARDLLQTPSIVVYSPINIPLLSIEALSATKVFVEIDKKES